MRLFNLQFMLFRILLFISAVYCCRTPDGIEGECMLLEECQSFLDLRKHVTDGNYLRKFQCGPITKQVHVCCSKSTVVVTRYSSELLLKPAECGVTSENRIAYGRATSLSEHPWTAILEYVEKGRTQLRCGATLINQRYLITAAHCVTSDLKYARLGDYDLTKRIDCEEYVNEEICAPPAKSIVIEKVIKHENFQYGQNDIALLRLDQDVQFNEFIMPICLPLENSLRRKSFIGREVTIVGFGKTEIANYSNVKLKGQLKIIENNVCQTTYSGYKLQNGQLCAEGVEGRGDSCQGDSGNAVMIENPLGNQPFWYMIGIVSFGKRDCRKTNPGVYTRVSEYINWMKRNMKA